ncbi:MAG: bifunctional aspartate transaminase/aspartate 4-decarboxylase [Ilumatobacteraceae bacterium]|nr:bifunctional aspartate transaminase/aspartate 4-decarboxylase [Ilumatobacteraceae bacterium]
MTVTSAELTELAQRSGRTVLDAGRGQPDWIATRPRDALFALGRFAVSDAKHHSPSAQWGVTPPARGIADRLRDAISSDTSPGASFLRASIDLVADDFGIDPDNWIHEISCGVLGDGYPDPNRMLRHVERVVERYFTEVMGVKDAEPGTFELFATEGGAAAMAYVFRSLQENRVIEPGGKVAISTPVFTPYLQIPTLEDFGFEVVALHAAEGGAARSTDHLLEHLSDPAISVFCVINPGNPDARTIPPDDLHRLEELVRGDRPDLLIVADSVYAAFVDGFRGLVATIPRNVICVHSFSKAFGATGLRLGFVAMHRDHRIDQLWSIQDESTAASLAARYSTLGPSERPPSFMSRLVADSREVALHNIAGLATPDQVQMALFALSYLMPHGHDGIAAIHDELTHRERALFDPLGIDPPTGTGSAYYALVDLRAVATSRLGEPAGDRLVGSIDPGDILRRVAAEHGVVVLPGAIFGADPWEARVSLASLPVEAIGQIGRAIVDVVDTFAHR